jgi:hypothetical protein
MAHPGIGLVIDSKGNIYYTDLRQIWKQTPNGEKSVVVPNVHSHELYMDKHDNLFGEHYWYESAQNKFYHYQWCLKNTGELIHLSENLVANTPIPDFSFVRDDNGNMYWYEKAKTDTIHFIKRDTTGHKTKIASGLFKDIRWMFSTPNGEAYFLDLDDLYSITSDNKIELVAKNLCTGTLWTIFAGKKHSVFGVWFDNAGNIYTAVTEDKCIKKINQNGEIAIVYKSENGSPINGLFDSSGSLWVLDNVGVKKVELTEISKEQVWFSNNSKYLFGLTGLVAVLLIIRRLIRNNKKQLRQT